MDGRGGGQAQPAQGLAPACCLSPCCYVCQAAAASCSPFCSLVERSAAWVEDPAAAEGMEGGDGMGEGAPVLTLAALQREYAVVRGHRALAAAMPGGRRGHASLASGGGHGGLAEALRGGDAEGVFAQLLALGEFGVG